MMYGLRPALVAVLVETVSNCFQVLPLQCVLHYV